MGFLKKKTSMYARNACDEASIYKRVSVGLIVLYTVVQRILLAC